MPEVNNLLGQKFGRLKVIKFHKIVNHRAMWLCLCTCGKRVLVTGHNLSSGTTKSCKCLRSDWRKLRPYESLYNNLITSCYKRGIECSIDYKGFVKLTKLRHCHYCNAGVTWSKFAISKNGQGYNLDRKDNNLGYSKANCVVCCPRCNRGKHNLFAYAEWYSMTDCLRNGWRLV